jgi:predicted metal-dependent hydrolase
MKSSKLGAPELEVRNLRFDVDADIPRYWHAENRSVTAFFNNLSVFFPPGERFFIASVKAHREHVDDARLRAEVRSFCAQEGVHSREHVRYNRMLEAQGYPVVAMERRVERLLAFVTRRSTKRRQLAVTCALEHFTALMAHSLLSKPDLLAGAHPVMAALWRWHAAEENEHKAVAFDVYRAAGGTYPERCAVMIGSTLVFWAKVVEQQLRLMRCDRTLFSLREWRALYSFLFVAPGGLRNLLGPYFAYFRPSFHPWDLDNRDLLEAWKAELATLEEYQQAA